MGPPAYSMHQVHAKRMPSACQVHVRRMPGACQVHVRCISGCAANAYILHAPYMHACVLSWLVNIVTYISFPYDHIKSSTAYPSFEAFYSALSLCLKLPTLIFSVGNMPSASGFANNFRPWNGEHWQ